jgi:hypothetical protein
LCVFFRANISCFYLLKRKSRLKPATGAQFFVARRRTCKKSLKRVRICSVQQPYDGAVTLTKEITQLSATGAAAPRGPYGSESG